MSDSGLQETLTRNGQSGKLSKSTILEDYKLAVTSREASILGRKEVLTGKAKFGIFGDGKELPQIAMARQFQNGDFRAGYYRDQTLMMAIGQLSLQQFFAQLYAHPDIAQEPHSGGRQMSSHYATRSLNPDGTWKNLLEMKNSSADISPTAGQMARLIGLAYASKIYRNHDGIEQPNQFSDNGNEVAFGTIGDSSTSEGIFWEAVNAAGVLGVPMVLSVYDDGYGISVSKKYQTVKESISKVLRGFERSKHQNGIEIFRVKAWDYKGLLKTYAEADRVARNEHVPVLVHVEEVTQPLGHSTSGSHERYKSKQRLQFEENFNCNVKFREWILKNEYATEQELAGIEEEARKEVQQERNKAWKALRNPINEQVETVKPLLDKLIEQTDKETSEAISKEKEKLKAAMNPIRKDVLIATKKSLRYTRGMDLEVRKELIDLKDLLEANNQDSYGSHVYSESEFSPLNVEEVPPSFPEKPEEVDGRVILRDNFDRLMDKYPEIIVFGEDTGYLGGVNKSLEGLQEKYGETRVSDTGIREASIVGQGIGAAMRGLRPIAEVQYLDYILYCFQELSDDLATVQYRTKGGQKAPLIVRTRGHRLEGIWHSGSPMGMILHGVRGVRVCVPRNMTDAAGMYNTLMQGDDPAIIVEPLNAYRNKENMPENLGEYTVPLGIPEFVTRGDDVTIVSYGSTCNLAEEAVHQLADVGISAELIDVRTLIPFDRHHMIRESLEKTNRIVFVDEDMPGATTSYMMQQVLEDQLGYYLLDSEPVTLSARNHRPAYGSDGDYFSKPNTEDIFDKVYNLMHEVDPVKYPQLYA